MARMGVTRRQAIGVAVSAAAWSRAAGAAAVDVRPAVDAAARQAIDGGACPGVSVAVAERGRITYAKGYGLADLGTGAPVAPTTVFRLGSLTKQFTAAAVVKLAAEGRLDLDEPASRRLAFLRPLPGFTLRELMNHTAGLHDAEGEAHEGAPRSSTELARMIAVQPKPFDFSPGSAWLYSNANYIMLGAVVEQVTGRPFDAALAALIFRPLGLGSIAVDRATAVVPDRASGYTPVEGPRRFAPAEPIEVFEAGGAGALRGTAPDLCRWHHALLGGRLFPARWVEEMLRPGRLRDGRVSGANRFSAEDASYGETQYGLGLLLPPATAKGRHILHYGYINGFSACLETLVERRQTVAILCNADGGPSLPFRAIRRSVFSA
jgi:CubicO group peptidase (beta-lactamase class C family)